MKKIITLAFLMAFALSACGDGGDFMMKKKEKTKPEEEVSTKVEPMISYESFQVYKECGKGYIKCNKKLQDSLSIMYQLMKEDEDLFEDQDEDKDEGKDEAKVFLPYMMYQN